MYVRLPSDFKLNPEQQALVIQELNRRRANANCPRCRNPNFSLLDTVFNLPLPSSGFGGQTVPYVVAVCTNCGFMAEHSLGALDIQV
jgi:hypothetical protein